MKHTLMTGVVFAALIGLFAFAANDGRAPWAGKPPHGADWCEAHQTALSTCEKCNVRLARGGTFSMREREPKDGECPNTLVRVTLAPGVAKSVALEYHTLAAREVSEILRANAETQYPPSAYARIAPRIPGVVREVRVAFGQEVEAGAVLAIVESPEFGEAKSDYLQAEAVLALRRATSDQEQALFDRKVSSGRELLQAKSALEEARLALDRAGQRLALLGMPPEDLKTLPAKKDTSALLEVRAPFGGLIVEMSAVIGETAAPEKPVFAVAAMDRMWVSIDVDATDLGRIERDQRVVFTMDGLTGRRFPGRIAAVGGEVDDRTRTVHVYADIKNVQGLLRAQMFGRAEIVVKPAEPKLLVPREAVQSDGDCNLVFVSPTPDVFQARKIELGTAYEGGYEIVGGLAAGERVVTTGSFLLKTEVLRGQMGAG